MNQIEHDRFERATSRLRARLHQHQKDGVKWLIGRDCDHDGVMGAILADDMGLGKTIQTISLILSTHQTDDLPVIIICDKSLMRQWESEIHRFSSLPVIVMEKHQIDTFSVESLRNTIRGKVIICPWSALKSQNIQAIEFDRLILDEAHKIRNRRSQVHTFARIVRQKCRFALAITGTPIMKHKYDLESLLHFIGEFGQNLQGGSAKYVLRRTFKEIGEHNARFALPQLKTKLHEVQLNATEKTIYNQLIETGQILTRARENADTAEEHRDVTNHLFKVILRLQQCVVSHQIVSSEELDGLFAPTFEEIAGNDSCCICLADEMTQDNICRTACNHTLCRDCLTRWCIQSPLGDPSCPICRTRIQKRSIQIPYGEQMPVSSKLSKIMEIMRDDVKRDEKTIIFCHWRSEMKEISTVLNHMGISWESITGSDTTEERYDKIRHFQGGAETKVLLCMIQIGSCGLNITAAKHCIFPSLDWTPATHLQAIARAHRLGQTSQVTAHFISASGTIDAHVINKQYDKILQFTDIFHDPEMMAKIKAVTDKKTDLFHILRLVT